MASTATNTNPTPATTTDTPPPPSLSTSAATKDQRSSILKKSSLTSQNSSENTSTATKLVPSNQSTDNLPPPPPLSPKTSSSPSSFISNTTTPSILDGEILQQHIPLRNEQPSSKPSSSSRHRSVSFRKSLPRIVVPRTISLTDDVIDELSNDTNFLLDDDDDYDYGGDDRRRRSNSISVGNDNLAYVNDEDDENENEERQELFSNNNNHQPKESGKNDNDGNEPNENEPNSFESLNVRLRRRNVPQYTDDSSSLSKLKVPLLVDSMFHEPSAPPLYPSSSLLLPPFSSPPETDPNVPKDWDRAITLPPPDEDETLNSEWVDISIKWLKIFAYFFTFIVVLSFAVFSKSLTMLMTSMAKADHVINVCNQDDHYIIQPELDHDKQYMVRYRVDSAERMAWMWCIYFATIAPYFFALLRSLRICFFKSFKVCSCMTLTTVFLLETAHCIGLALLLFHVLPNLEVTKGTMMMNTVCTIPALLRIPSLRKRTTGGSSGGSTNTTASNTAANTRPATPTTTFTPNNDIGDIVGGANSEDEQHVRPRSFHSGIANKNNDTNTIDTINKRRGTHANTGDANTNAGKQNKNNSENLFNNHFISWLTFSLQLFSILIWTIIGYLEDMSNAYLLPVALILVSFEWWENYIIPGKMHPLLQPLETVMKDLKHSRYFIGCLLNIYKMVLLFGLMLLVEYATHSEAGTVKMMFKNFTDGFSYVIPVVRYKGSVENAQQLPGEEHKLFVGNHLWPMWLLFIHITFSYICYAFAKFTCKVCIQGVSFAVPITLTVPVTVCILWAFSNLAIRDKCQMLNLFEPFQYIFWFITEGDKKFDFSFKDKEGWVTLLASFIWLVGLATQITCTLHIWRETSERLAPTEHLFVNPMYNAMLLDQSLAMNRRCIKVSYQGEQDVDMDQEGGDKRKKSKRLSTAPIIAISEEKRKSLKRNNIFHAGVGGNEMLHQNPLYTLANGDEDDDDNGNGITVHQFNRKNFDDDDGDCDDGANDEMNELDEEMLAAQQAEYWAQQWRKICAEQGIEEDSIDAKPNPADDDIVRIYACATMWHEDRNEMLQMLKAVNRLDLDQWARSKAKHEFGDDSQYYELEINIFFDDAYEQGSSDEEEDRVVNRFVEQLMDVINEAANQVHEKNVIIDNPVVVPTPYGGKIIWTLLGGNRLIAHVKDKNLIRHRKRWSQCMYMYYLLGYRLDARSDLSEQRKRKIANNTFILALDGDINFQPAALHMVVDLMKKNPKLGAACGRIHPIGSGPIVWYQKFEYAIGHWLQKATEHVFGCVLCSPGCFSLFRSRAVMDKSVMNKYTTKPTEALHYVQYDQGEDRWLCTLMLQRGWRIEYCAASDSYTHAPEGFGEFYTQRRRWAPSTMANIIDLLGDYRRTVQVNENISMLYITYQALLMLGTILSPGNIFLMVVSSMNTAMNLESGVSFIINFFPLLGFSFVCLYFKNNDIKINIAMVMTVGYALLMLAVLVGIGIDMYDQGVLSPNSLFFIMMMGSFVLAAILHPQEFACLIPLPVYMLLIPSMYLLLDIYSVTNMHVVSWGTREVKSKLSAKELAAQKEEEEQRAAAAAAAAAKKGGGGLLNFIDFSKYTSGKNGLFTCLCCSGGMHDDSLHGTVKEIHTGVIELKTKVGQINHQLPGIRRSSIILNNNGTLAPLDIASVRNSAIIIDNDGDFVEYGEQEDGDDNGGNDGGNGEQQESINNGGNDAAAVNYAPMWVRTHKTLKNYPIRHIPQRERDFWLGLIEKYLYPLDEDLKEKERIQNALEELRNQCVFAFGFINVIFVLFVFMLQLHKDIFGVDIPVKWYKNYTYNEEEDKIEEHKYTTYTRMDPIGLVLVVFFGTILIVQIIGMFIHRFGTLAHLLAYTKIDFFSSKSPEDDDFDGEHGFDFANYIKSVVVDANRQQLTKQLDNNTDSTGSSGGGGGGNFDGGGRGGGLQMTPLNEEKEEEYSEARARPISTRVNLDNLFEKQMEKFNDDTQLSKLPSLMRKNTKIAKSRRRKPQRHASFTSTDRRSDSLLSATSGVSFATLQPVNTYNTSDLMTTTATNNNRSSVPECATIATTSLPSTSTMNQFGSPPPPITKDRSDSRSSMNNNNSANLSVTSNDKPSLSRPSILREED